MFCLPAAVCCPCLSLTEILSPLKFDGPYCESSSLHSCREPILWASRPILFNICSVFRISQCRAQRLIEDKSSSRRHVRSSRRPVNLYWQFKKRKISYIGTVYMILTYLVTLTTGFTINCKTAELVRVDSHFFSFSNWAALNIALFNKILLVSTPE